MPLRSTERSDGLTRPGWKDGSQLEVGERTAARTTPDVAITHRPACMTEAAEQPARNRQMNTEADAGSHTRSRRGAGVCLALLPYGRRKKRAFRSLTPPIVALCSCLSMALRQLQPGRGPPALARALKIPTRPRFLCDSATGADARAPAGPAASLRCASRRHLAAALSHDESDPRIAPDSKRPARAACCAVIDRPNIRTAMRKPEPCSSTAAITALARVQSTSCRSDDGLRGLEVLPE